MDWDSWLRMGLGVSKDDLRRIRQFLGIRDNDFTFRGIAICYHICRITQVVGLSIDELFKLASTFRPGHEHLTSDGLFTEVLENENQNLAEVWLIDEIIQSLKGIGLSIYRLSFLSNGSFDAGVNRTHTFVEMYGVDV